jgi:hypothetical protein
MYEHCGRVLSFFVGALFALSTRNFSLSHTKHQLLPQTPTHCLNFSVDLMSQFHNAATAYDVLNHHDFDF